MSISRNAEIDDIMDKAYDAQSTLLSSYRQTQKLLGQPRPKKQCDKSTQMTAEETSALLSTTVQITQKNLPEKNSQRSYLGLAVAGAGILGAALGLFAYNYATAPVVAPRMAPKPF